MQSKANLVRDGFVNERFERRSADVLDDAGDNVALALHRTDNRNLARTDTASPAAAAALVHVPVLGLAADESFVHLYDAA